MTLYFEDLTTGRSGTYGSHRMDREAMIAFAEQFDPLPMHVDSEAAAEAGYRDVIASGIHTLGVAQRLLVDGFLAETAGRAGLGFDDLRFHEPVYPGDVLSVHHEVIDKRRSASDPGVGIVTNEFAVLRTETADDDPEDGEMVTSWTGAILVDCRTTDDGR